MKLFCLVLNFYKDKSTKNCYFARKPMLIKQYIDSKNNNHRRFQALPSVATVEIKYFENINTLSKNMKCLRTS